VSLVVVDTDVASTLLRRRISDTLARQLAGHTIAITFVTYGELTKWTLVRHWGPRSLDTMRTFLAALVVLPYDQRVATRWGEIQGLRPAPRPPAPGQRLLDRRLLPRPRTAARHVQRQGLRRLRRARRSRTRPMRTVGVECLVERTTAHARSAETQDANRKPR
jgi:hypothetical protein